MEINDEDHADIKCALVSCTNDIMDESVIAV